MAAEIIDLWLCRIDIVRRYEYVEWCKGMEMSVQHKNTNLFTIGYFSPHSQKMPYLRYFSYFMTNNFNPHIFPILLAFPHFCYKNMLSYTLS